MPVDQRKPRFVTAHSFALVTAVFFWGSCQSREGDERLEAKVDRLPRERGVDPADGTDDPVVPGASHR